eukprot:11849777-Karenia_brevis.AAC.1
MGSWGAPFPLDFFLRDGNVANPDMFVASGGSTGWFGSRFRGFTFYEPIHQLHRDALNGMNHSVIGYAVPLLVALTRWQ